MTRSNTGMLERPGTQGAVASRGERVRAAGTERTRTLSRARLSGLRFTLIAASGLALVAVAFSAPAGQQRALLISAAIVALGVAPRVLGTSSNNSIIPNQRG